MVNRPGRSKGCITCRRRKVKCDEERPVCQRCIKSGNTCDGYQEGRAFVWVGSKESDLTQSNAQPEDQSGPSRPTASSEILRLQPSSSAQQESFFASIDPVLREGFTRPVLPIELDHRAFRESIYQTHMFQHLLGHTESGKQGALFTPTPNPTELNKNSVNALSMTFFGRMHNLPEVSHQGDLLYSKAILQLAGKLNGHDNAISTEVLAATLTLTVHEIVNSTAYNGWTQHAGGIGRLLEARGPWRHQSPHERILFESSRPMIIAKALSDRKRTFLEYPDWQTIPWALNTSLKTQQSQIFDFLSFVPGLFEDMASFKSTVGTASTIDPSLGPSISSSINQNRLTLTARVDSILASLKEWYRRWLTLYPAAEQPVPSPHFSPTSDPGYPTQLFGPPLFFTSLLQANEYNLYNTTTFLLLTIASQLASSAPTLPSGKTTPSHLNSPTLDLASTSIPSNLSQHRRLVATEICRAVPYHLQFDTHAYSGAYLLCFPLNVLLGIYGMKTEKGQWISNVLADIAENWGILAGNAWSQHIREKLARGESVDEEGQDDGW